MASRFPNQNRKYAIDFGTLPNLGVVPTETMTSSNQNSKFTSDHHLHAHHAQESFY